MCNTYKSDPTEFEVLEMLSTSSKAFIINITYTMTGEHIIRVIHKDSPDKGDDFFGSSISSVIIKAYLGIITC